MSTYVLISKMRVDVTKNIYLLFPYSFYDAGRPQAYFSTSSSLSTLTVTHAHAKIVIQIN